MTDTPLLDQQAAAGTSTSAAVARRALGERVALLYRQMPTLLVGHGLIAGVLIYMIWDHPATPAALTTWLVVFECIVLARVVHVLRYRQAEDAIAHGKRWGWQFAVGAAATGLCWGYAGWVFYLPLLQVSFPIVMIFAGLTALSATSASLFYPAHLAFVIPCLAPLAIRNLLIGGSFFTGLGIAIFIGLAGFALLARRYQQVIANAFTLRFENEELLELLKAENTRVRAASARTNAANAAKSRFLAAASHDLRQPVQALMLFMAELRNRSHEPPDEALLDNMQSACDAQRSLLNALLDMSRADPSVVKPDISEFPLAPVLHGVQSQFASLAESRGLTLRVAPTSRWARSDEKMLERILRNLGSNAVRHTQQGGVLLGVRGSGETLRVAVYDTGPGIPEDQQSEIFGEFVQLANPERDHRKGLGLGLPIVQGLATALGTELGLKSVPGRGSQFWIELQACAPGVSTARQESAPGDPLTGKRVALIEDEPLIREGLAVIMRGWGCDVLVGENAQEVIAASGDLPPDVILADYRLREDRTGIGEIQALHAHFGPPTPAVLLTGETAPGQLAKINEAGFPILHKPVMPLKLRAGLSAALSGE